MAHTPSAKKRAKQYLKARSRNRIAEAAMKREQKDLLAALEKKDKAAIESALKAYNSILDKAAKRGTIKKNQATRKKTRAAAAARKAVVAA